MSKRSDHIKQLREQTPDELRGTIGELRRTIEKVRIDQGFSRTGDQHDLRKKRQELAQAETILKEMLNQHA